MTEQTPSQPEFQAPTPAPAPKDNAKPSPPPSAPSDTFKSEESKNAVLADLRREREARQALEAQAQKQRDALAAALGVKPEETSNSDKLAQQIETLRGQIVASERRALAVEYKVPENMLTATDAEGMRQQATQLVEFAQAAHYAALTAAPTPPPPSFQPNPGQGQGGGALTPEAQAAAEYEKYYPSTP